MAESYSLSHTNITSNSSKPSITLTDKEEFFINFFQYREILSINIDGYEIKKDGKQEYTVKIIFFS